MRTALMCMCVCTCVCLCVGVCLQQAPALGKQRLGLAQRLQKESPGRLPAAWPEAHGPAERPVVAGGTSVWVCLFVGTEDVPSLLWERRVPPAA